MPARQERCRDTPFVPFRGAPEGTNGVSLQRYIPMLLRGIGVALVLEHLQSADQLGPRLLRLDNVVNEAVRSGDVGVGELLLVLGHQLPASGLGVGAPLDL